MHSVSVIIPNYNKGNYLRRCVESVNSQSYPITEIIIVDDKSTDNSVTIISELAQKYSNVFPVYLDKNQGVSHARNQGFLESKGEYVTFLDADDFFFDKQRIEKEMELLERNPNEIVFSKLKLVDLNENELSEPPVEYLEGDISFKLLLGRGKYCVTHYYLISRQFIEEAGMYPENMTFYEDLDLIFRLSFKHQFRGTGIYGTAYRKGTNGLSKKGTKDHEKARRDIQRKYLCKVSRLKRIYIICYWKFMDIYRSIRRCKLKWTKSE